MVQGHRARGMHQRHAALGHGLVDSEGARLPELHALSESHAGSNFNKHGQVQRVKVYGLACLSS